MHIMAIFIFKRVFAQTPVGGNLTIKLNPIQNETLKNYIFF